MRKDEGHGLLVGWRPYALIALLGAAIYGQSVSFDFNYCDDYREIVERHERIEDFSRIPSAFTSGFGEFYRPVLRISQIIDAQISGTSPWAYHLSNVAYHLCASCLAFLLLVRLGYSRAVSLVFSLLFASHPLQAAAVAWIPGRNDTLLALFILAAFISLIRLEERSTPWRYAAHFFAFAAALFTKETAVAFPLVGLYYLTAVRSGKFFSRRTALLCAGWTAVGGLWLLLRFAALSHVSSEHITGLRAFAKNWPALPALMGKVILPWKMSGLATFEAASIAAGAALLLLLAGFAAFTRGIDYGRIGFGALWFLLFLVPTFIGRVPTADDHFEYMEHRAYLPLLGMWIVIIEVLLRRGVRFERRSILVALFIVLAVLSVRSFLYARTFRERILFWETAVEYDPTRSNFHSVLGKLYYEEGDFEKAGTQFRKAAELSKRNDPDNYNNLATILNKTGRTDEAVSACGKAIELDPRNPDYPYHLGRILFDAERFDEAEGAFLETIRIDPGKTDAYIFMVAVQTGRGDIDGAVETCRKIIARDPNHFHAHNIMGDLYARQGKMEEAAEAWKRITRIKPGYLPVYENLMKYFLEAERTEDARCYALELLRRGGTVSSAVRRRLGLPE